MDPKDKEILKDYETSLEDLTFNSKPIINMLTMLAEKHKHLAPQIVEFVQSRFFKVRQEHKIPTLYLMDSMIKNLGGEFLEVISKNIVGVFCHAFECMNDPKIRISLYKLRQTWPPYIPVKKLAAIDKHINAIDPNWPITAQDPSRQDPSSPTIFLNPKFLGSQKEENIEEPASSSETAASKPSQRNSPPTKVVHHSKGSALSQSADMKDSIKNLPKEKVKKRSQSPKDEKTQHQSRSPVRVSKEKPLNRSRSPLNVKVVKSRKSKSPLKIKDEKPQQQSQNSNKSSNLSIQDRRQKLLEEQRQKKFDKQRAMGLLPPKEEKQRSLSPSPEKKNTDPRLKSSTRPRSASPTVAMETNKNVPLDEVKDITGVKHKIIDTLEEPASKQLRIDKDYSTNDKSLSSVHKDMVDSTSSEDHFKTISCDLLELNDLPPELLRQHQDYMLKQAEIRLKSGTLSKEEHDTLVKKVDQLYDLQRQTNQNRILKKPNSPPQNNQNLSHFSSSHVPPSSSHIPPSQPPPPSHNFSVHHHTHPLSNHMSHSNFDDKFPPVRGRRPHIPSRGSFRPWPRDGPRDIPRPRHRGQGFHNRPPPFRGSSPPRHFPRPGPPPPSQGRPLGPPPSHSMNVVDLYQQLEKTGLFKVDPRPPDRGPNMPSISHPLPLIPEIRLIVKDLKKRYDHVTDLLHRGEPCTSCGLRFTEDQRDAYQQHLDWHYQENRMDKEGTRGMMRNWYLRPDDWLTFEGTQLPNQNEPVLTMEQEVREESVGREEERGGVSCQVLPGEDNQVCGVCHEQLEQFWEEDEEEWHFRDAIRTPDSQLFHSYCYLDSKESQGLMSLESSPIEERDRPVLQSKT